MASYLVHSSRDRVVWVGALAGFIVSCSRARYLFVKVPLLTQVYKWAPANLMLRGNPGWTSITSRGGGEGSRNTLGCSLQHKPG